MKEYLNQGINTCLPRHRLKTFFKVLQVLSNNILKHLIKYIDQLLGNGNLDLCVSAVSTVVTVP